MSGVVLLFTVPVLAAVLVYLLRRWPTPSTALAGFVAAGLGYVLWLWPNDQPVIFLGRVIRLNQPVVVVGQHLEMSATAQWAIGFMALIPGGGFSVPRPPPIAVAAWYAALAAIMLFLRTRRHEPTEFGR